MRFFWTCLAFVVSLLSFRRKHRCFKPYAAKRRGIALLQMVIAVAILILLSGMIYSQFSSSRRSAHSATCDVKLKQIALALDAYQQNYGAAPASLAQLQQTKFLNDPGVLHCASDPRPNGSYNEYYLLRARRDKAELPVVVCPFHEASGDSGAQAFKGRYSKRFKVRAAVLENAEGATVESPGKNPISARSGMQVRGGDRIRTTSGGATIRFADDSSCVLEPNSDLTVLQSFINGASQAPLYTLVHQTAGNVLFRVTHGSKFDVATPTATAGALGTEFRIAKKSDNRFWLQVIKSRVYRTTLKSTTTFEPVLTPGATDNSWVVLDDAPVIAPTPTPTPSPTPTPTPNDDDDDDNAHNNKNKDKH